MAEAAWCQLDQFKRSKLWTVPGLANLVAMFGQFFCQMWSKIPLKISTTLGVTRATCKFVFPGPFCSTLWGCEIAFCCGFKKRVVRFQAGFWPLQEKDVFLKMISKLLWPHFRNDYYYFNDDLFVCNIFYSHSASSCVLDSIQRVEALSMKIIEHHPHHKIIIKTSETNHKFLEDGENL